MEPYANAKRWSISEKEITIPQPQLISKYNKLMGGNDHLDWLVQKYRIGIWSKKRCFSLFTNCLDVSLVNAWILHFMCTHSPLSQLKFKSFVAKYYLKLQSHSDPELAGRPKRLSAIVAAVTRLSPIGMCWKERMVASKESKKFVTKRCPSSAEDVTLACILGNVSMFGIVNCFYFSCSL